MPLRRGGAIALALSTAFVAMPAAAAAAAAAPPPAQQTLVGTYQRMTKDVDHGGGHLRDVYTDLIEANGRSYTLHLPKNAPQLDGGATVRVRGQAQGRDFAAASVETLAPAPAIPTTGTTKVLVILAYWTAPDTVTREQAAAQILGDDDGWYDEASYGQLRLTGAATPWVQIPEPPGGLCFDEHLRLMADARAAAQAIGYDYTQYDRTIVYFPKCTGYDASGAAGWAYVPGTTVWLNGYMDRRVSVHEQGHNYGLSHAHTLECQDDAGNRVTFDLNNCWYDEYGDNYDAMGGSRLVCHFSAFQKNALGWMNGRKKALTTSSETFTLAPLESRTVGTQTADVWTDDPQRRYWLEYRQPLGYDAALPVGAANGVIVHLSDDPTWTDRGPYLLDASAGNDWSNVTIPAGGSWTSPEGITIAVGSVTPSGATVTVTGNRPTPLPPSVPRSFTAAGVDQYAQLSWQAPESDGGAPLTGYLLTRQPGNVTTRVDVTQTSLKVSGLANDTTYTFRLVAQNVAGSGPYAEATATPTLRPPSVTLTAPAPSSTLVDTVTLSADAAPNAVTNKPVTSVSFAVDGTVVTKRFSAPWTAAWDTTKTTPGAHTITAIASDGARTATSAPVNVTVVQPHPTVTITAPADGTVANDDVVTLRATAAPDPGTNAAVQRVEYRTTTGRYVGNATAGPDWQFAWNTATWNAGETHAVVARAVDVEGHTGVSAPVNVTVNHPVPSGAITAPAPGATVGGTVTIAVTGTAGPTVVEADFYVDGLYVGSDYGAPFQWSWDTTGKNGAHVLTATVHDAPWHAGKTAAVNVVVDNDRPSVAVTAPASGAAVDATTLLLAATATPNAGTASPITHVAIAVDGDPVADIPAPGPYQVPWNAAGHYGAHTVVATAYDAAGKSIATDPVPFTVNEPSPSAAITSPAGGSVVRAGTVHVTVAAAPDLYTGAAVTAADLYVDGAKVGAMTLQPDGSFAYDWTAARGAHSVAAKVYDADGFDGNAAAVVLTVADAPGVPGAVTAIPGANATATVSWNAPADDGGSPVTGYVVRRNDGVEYAAASSPFVVTGLANGTGYSFRVLARNAAADGALSAATATVVPGTRTALTITASVPVVTYPGSVTVGGRLTRTDTAGPLAGRTVQLLWCKHGTMTCAVVKTATTSTTGDVRIAYAPPSHRDVRLRFLASGQFLGVMSAAKYVQVRVAVTSAISRTSMPLGSTATLSGVVRPAHSGRNVYLQRYYSGAWHNVAYKAQSSTGAVSFSLRPATRGTYTYRLSFGGDTDHLGGYSPSRAVSVT